MRSDRRGQYHCSRKVVVSGRGTAGDLGVNFTIGSRGRVVSWDEGIDVGAVTHWDGDALGGGFFGARGGGFFGATVIVVVATIIVVVATIRRITI
jgi:hypothetical protein